MNEENRNRLRSAHNGRRVGKQSTALRLPAVSSIAPPPTTHETKRKSLALPVWEPLARNDDGQADISVQSAGGGSSSSSTSSDDDTASQVPSSHRTRLSAFSSNPAQTPPSISNTFNAHPASHTSDTDSSSTKLGSQRTVMKKSSPFLQSIESALHPASPTCDAVPLPQAKVHRPCFHSLNNLADSHIPENTTNAVINGAFNYSDACEHPEDRSASPKRSDSQLEHAVTLNLAVVSSHKHHHDL